MSDSRTEVANQARIADSVQEEIINRIEISVLEFLNSCGAATESVIHRVVRGRRGSKLRALRKLCRLGRVRRVGSGKKCDPFHYEAVRLERSRPDSKEIFVEEVIL